MLLIVTLGVGIRVIRQADMINEWRILRIIRFRCFLVSMGVTLCSRGYLLRLALYVPPFLSIIHYLLSIPFRLPPSVSHFPYDPPALSLSFFSFRYLLPLMFSAFWFPR